MGFGVNPLRWVQSVGHATATVDRVIQSPGNVSNAWKTPKDGVVTAVSPAITEIRPLAVRNAIAMGTVRSRTFVTRRRASVFATSSSRDDVVITVSRGTRISPSIVCRANATRTGRWRGKRATQTWASVNASRALRVYRAMSACRDTTRFRRMDAQVRHFFINKKNSWIGGAVQLNQTIFIDNLGQRIISNRNFTKNVLLLIK